MSRLVLAATLAANYGIYGPAYELLEHQPREAGSEEYLHSEESIRFASGIWDVASRQPRRLSLRASTAPGANNPALHDDYGSYAFSTST